MLIDITGTILIPGRQGKDCPGNGNSTECCCDECDYLQCCLDSHDPNECLTCRDSLCPRNKKSQNN